MMTVRQIDRLFAAKDFSRLLHDLTSHRADALMRWEKEANRGTLAAAMSAIRLDELNQAHLPLAGKMLQTVLAAQEADGGWGDALATALCLRALLGRKGDGVAVERGLVYLRQLQKEDGSFPAGPFRRMPADAHTTASVLYLLAEYVAFWTQVQSDQAATWLDEQAEAMDEATKLIWKRGGLRCRSRSHYTPQLPGIFAKVA